MSVVMVVKVSEGLVLGADSAAALHGRLEGPKGVQEGVVKIYYNAKKLLQIGDFPIGLLTWGQAYVGMRTMESLVREWEYDSHWQSRKEYKKKHNTAFKVRECAEKWYTHLARLYSTEFGNRPTEQRPALGVVIAGYSEGDFFPEIWRFVLPIDDKVHNQRPNKDGKPDFGANWFGLVEPIVRLHWGRDDRAVAIISEKFDIPQQDVRKALEPLQYRVPFAVMPLQDAIEYAQYTLDVAIGRYRFVIGPELCGGEIDIAAVTQREFKWISRKTWGLE